MAQQAHALGTTRRTLVRGAAWSVPVVSLAVTVPAYAASPIPCPVIPQPAQWTATTATGTLASKADDYQWYTTTNKWVIYKDNGSTTASLTFASSSPAIAVTPGATYNGSFSFYWQYGNGASAQSTGGTFDVLVNGVSVKSLTTRTAAVGATAATTTQTFSYVAPAGTTSIVITYRYVLTPRVNAASDDIIVTAPSFSTCTVN